MSFLFTCFKTYMVYPSCWRYNIGCKLFSKILKWLSRLRNGIRMAIRSLGLHLVGVWWPPICTHVNLDSMSLYDVSLRFGVNVPTANEMRRLVLQFVRCQVFLIYNIMGPAKSCNNFELRSFQGICIITSQTVAMQFKDTYLIVILCWCYI